MVTRPTTRAKVLCTQLSYEFYEGLLTGADSKWCASVEADRSILRGWNLTVSFVLFSSRPML